MRTFAFVALLAVLSSPAMGVNLEAAGGPATATVDKTPIDMKKAALRVSGKIDDRPIDVQQTIKQMNASHKKAAAAAAAAEAAKPKAAPKPVAQPVKKVVAPPADDSDSSDDEDDGVKVDKTKLGFETAKWRAFKE